MGRRERLTLRKQVTADISEFGVQLVEKIVDDSRKLGAAICAGVEAGRLRSVSPSSRHVNNERTVTSLGVGGSFCGVAMVGV